MADFGYDCATPGMDLDPSLALCTGRRLLAYDLIGRLSTPHGSLWYDEDYGYDVLSFLNDDLSPAEISGMRVGIVTECLKDERVDAADVEATVSADRKLTLRLRITDGDGPFDLVLLTSAVGIEVLNLAA